MPAPSASATATTTATATETGPAGVAVMRHLAVNMPLGQTTRPGNTAKEGTMKIGGGTATIDILVGIGLGMVARTEAAGMTGGMRPPGAMNLGTRGTGSAIAGASGSGAAAPPGTSATGTGGRC